MKTIHNYKNNLNSFTYYSDYTELNIKCYNTRKNNNVYMYINTLKGTKLISRATNSTQNPKNININ